MIAISFSLLLLLLVILLQLRAYSILKEKNKVISQQALEIQQQNQSLSHQNQLLQKVNEEKQQIIGVVSHDLKGPFNRIFALIQLLHLTGQEMSENQKEYIGKIHQIAVDGLNMVSNLLDVRKLDDQVIELSTEPVAIAPFVTSFVKNYHSLAEKKKIKLLFDSTSSATVTADRLLLSRILDNLLSNAIKFSPPDKKVTVMIEETKNFVNLSVLDEGPGIDEEDQKKLYTKFQRLASRPTGGESSTGIGLSIVKTLVEKMGGLIRYEGGPGKGSKFTIALPKGTVT